MIIISKSGVLSGEPHELIKLSYVLNKDRFIEEFSKVKTKITCDEDLATLANICKSKLDTSGRIKDGDVVIMFDTLNVLDVINDRVYTKEEKESVKQYIIE